VVLKVGPKHFLYQNHLGDGGWPVKMNTLKPTKPFFFLKEGGGGGRGSGRGSERILSRFHVQHRAQKRSHDPETMT